MIQITYCSILLNKSKINNFGRLTMFFLFIEVLVSYIVVFTVFAISSFLELFQLHNFTVIKLGPPLNCEVCWEKYELVVFAWELGNETFENWFLFLSKSKMCRNQYSPGNHKIRIFTECFINKIFYILWLRAR